MPLNAQQVKAADKNRREKTYTLTDERGMYLEVPPRGSMRWRLKYRINGRENRISLGTYPDTPLSVAREKREEARAKVAKGVDPSAERKAAKAAAAKVADTGADSFAVVANEWYERMKSGWAPTHAVTIMSRLKRDVFPELGRVPVGEIDAPMVRRMLDRIVDRGAVETAKRVKVIVGQVLRYAASVGRGGVQHDCTSLLRHSLPSRKVQHFAAPVEPQQVGELLRVIDGYAGSNVTRAALRLGPLVAVRPGELRCAKWVDFDLDAARWTFTSSKTDTPLIVPLSRQALAVVREVELLTGAVSDYLFPSDRSKQRPMSNNTVNAAYRRMGITKDELTGHGWRACFRTLAAEVLGYAPEVIELQLAHNVRDPLGRSYNRTQWLPKRVEMMQAWADLLDELRKGPAEA